LLRASTNPRNRPLSCATYQRQAAFQQTRGEAIAVDERGRWLFCYGGYNQDHECFGYRQSI